jgi:hypothetical protein
MICFHLPQLRVASGKRMISTEKVLGIVFLVVLLGLLIWQAPAISSFFQGPNGDEPDYSQLNLAAGQYITYVHDGSTFVFSYGLSPTADASLFYVVKDSQQTRSYPATTGAVYHDIGLEIKVSSATSNLVTLQVKHSST